MKSINETFEDEEYQALIELKESIGNPTWRQFILLLTKLQDEFPTINQLFQDTLIKMKGGAKEDERS